MANQRMKLALGMEDENQTILCHGTWFLFSRRACQLDTVEKVFEADGIHKTESCLDEQGIMEGGMDSFRISRSGEFAMGHLHLPLTMMSANFAFLGRPKS